MRAQSIFHRSFIHSVMCIVLSLFIVLNPIYKTVNISFLIVSALGVFICFTKNANYTKTEILFLYTSFAISLCLLFLNQYTDLLGMSLVLFFSIISYKKIRANLLLILLIPIAILLMLKSFFYIQIDGISTLNGFYVNTSILIICVSILKRGKINLTTTIVLVIFTILFIILKSRLGFIATCSLLLYKTFDQFKTTRFRIISIIIFLSGLIPLLITKKISITGRLHINGFILDHLESVQLLSYNPFTNWYNHTIINHNANEMSQLIGEVYNVAFNDYLQILIQYGIIPFGIFLLVNLYILYILIKRKKGLFISCFLLINLMLLTSYPFFMTASLFFLFLFYIEIVTSEKIFKLNIRFKSTLITNTTSIKIITVLLFMALGSVYYYPKYRLFQHVQESTSINALVDSKLTKHAFRNHEIKFWVAKEYISKDSENAKRILLHLNDKILSYNMLLFTGEVFEHLGDYEAAAIYYEKSHTVRPFALLPIYKQLLIYDHVKNEQKVDALLKVYKNMQLRVDNDHTDIMRKEINKLIKKHTFQI